MIPVDQDAAGGPVSALASATRQRVLAAVAAEGPVTAGALAGRVGLTPAAVRRHLDAMVDAGLLRGGELVRTGGRGRPATAFSATDAGRSAVTGSLRGSAKEGSDLAAAALRQLVAVAGRGAVQVVAEQRAAALADRCSSAVEAAGDDIADRAEALAEVLNRDGYAASSRAVAPAAQRRAAPGGGGARPGATMAPSAVQLCQGSCPVQSVATEFPELCEAETAAFADLLGTHVRRLATLAHGEHVCTTHVPLLAVGSPRRRVPRSALQPGATRTTTDDLTDQSPTTGGTAP